MFVSIQLGISNEQNGKFGGIEPQLRWAESTSVGEYDLEVRTMEL